MITPIDFEARLWDYRHAHAVLRREGHVVNRKKIQRLWREECSQ